MDLQLSFGFVGFDWMAFDVNFYGCCLNVWIVLGLFMFYLWVVCGFDCVCGCLLVFSGLCLSFCDW